MMGDTAVAVNPKDERYFRFFGKYLWHPFRNEKIPVIVDDFVDPKFGTGAVKITPAHDQNDFDAGKRYNLPTIQVIDDKGNLTPHCGKFSGLRRFDARQAVLDELAKSGLYKGSDPHPTTVPICSRSKDVVELLVKPQWFVDCSKMAARAVCDVREGRLRIEPNKFENVWFNWLENVRDWCISRQLWWGHRIPVYSCHKKGNSEKPIWIAADSQNSALEKAEKILNCSTEEIEIKQDEDVLDTWFSSALQPFSAFGWPEQTADLKKYYPLSLMETGHDILFFWVARMVMLGTELTGHLPFNKILLHGIVCDSQGRKMSKSVGNVVAPEQVISGSSLEQLESTSKSHFDSGVLSKDEFQRAVKGQKKMFPNGIPECGADALKYTLLSHNVKSHFINFDVNECYTNKLFCNKIWQATKFTVHWCDIVKTLKNIDDLHADYSDLAFMDKWILSKLSSLVESVNDALENYDFYIATSKLKDFLYYNFCDIYLETTKRGLRENDELAVLHSWTLLKCLDVSLRTLAPFMPTLAQHLHEHLPLTDKEKEIGFPQPLPWRNEKMEKEVDNIMELVVAIRRLKKTFGVAGKHKPEVYIQSSISNLANHSDVIQDLSALHKIAISKKNDSFDRPDVVKDIVGSSIVYLVVADDLRKALVADLPKMEKKKDKILKELEKLQKTLNEAKYKENVTAHMLAQNERKVSELKEKLTRISYIQEVSK